MAREVPIFSMPLYWNTRMAGCTTPVRKMAATPSHATRGMPPVRNTAVHSTTV